jgi:anti-sigma factor RsiW
LNSLEAGRTRELRAHLETCEGCRRYLVEISSVAERLAAAETNPEVQTSEVFHQRLAARLRAAKQDSLGEILAAYFREICLNWRVAGAAIVAVAAIGATIALWRQSPEASSSPLAAIQTASASGADNDLAPTMANYQRVADESLDKLDALLTRQGDRVLPSLPIYTDSTLALAAEPF